MRKGFAAILVLGLIAAVLVLGGVFLLKQKSALNQKVSGPFSLNDNNVRYYLEKHGDRYTLNYAKSDDYPISIYVSSDTKMPLDKYFIAQNLIISGEFKKERHQIVNCVQPPCNFITETVIHLTKVELGPFISFPSPTPGPDWKTYTNTKLWYSYSYKYPDDFEVAHPDDPNPVFYSPDAQFKQECLPNCVDGKQIKGIKMWSMLVRPKEIPEDYKRGANIDYSIVSNIKLPEGFIAKAYVNDSEQSIKVILDYQKDPDGIIISLDCFLDNKRCKILLPKILSSFSFHPLKNKPVQITKDQAIECVRKVASKLNQNTKFTVQVTSDNDDTWFTEVTDDNRQASLMGWFPVNKQTCETHIATP